MVRAYTAPAALLAATPCDICVTEMDLGNMDGFALIEHVRERKSGVAAIFVTGTAVNAAVLKAWENHVSAWLLKPLECREDLERIERLLEEQVRARIRPDGPLRSLGQ